jgi:hypothetical protein
VVSKLLSFTEPAAQLTTELLLKKDVKCLGDADGQLNIAAAGGVQPYTYKLNRVLTQQSGSFSGLAPGAYTISIADKNGCATEYQNEIIILTTPMEVTLLKTDVSCHDGSDGAVQADVTGGALPLQYLWKNSTAETVGNVNLRAGTYSLTVTDQQACVQQKSITVSQPHALTAKMERYGSMEVEALCHTRTPLMEEEHSSRMRFLNPSQRVPIRCDLKTGTTVS